MSGVARVPIPRTSVVSVIKRNDFLHEKIRVRPFGRDGIILPCPAAKLCLALMKHDIGDV